MTYYQQELFPEYESESSSLAIKLFSDICCNGCTCKSNKDHLLEKDFFLDEIDFDQ